MRVLISRYNFISKTKAPSPKTLYDMKIIETPLPGVVLIEPNLFRDERGFFLESYHREKLREAGIREDWVQDNHSKSSKGVLRGLHFQNPHAQAKLCRVVQGAVWDVAVDIRVGSPTFGQWFGAVLSAENMTQIYVPAGFAHGFLVLTDTAEFLYKCSDFYSKESEGGIAWNDEEIGIAWPFNEYGITTPILSAKDETAPTLRDFPTERLPMFR
jgi:dTDP-4-dehydrorhamnose 3,5-epimerase